MAAPLRPRDVTSDSFGNPAATVSTVPMTCFEPTCRTSMRAW